MKKLFFPSALTLASTLLFCTLSAVEGFGQGTGFNTTGANPNAAALVDIDAGAGANRGLLIPRVTSAQRTANFNPLPAAAQGLVVYQTDGAQGFYYNTSVTTTPNWVQIGSGTSWGLTGNSGTAAGTNFIGTTDLQGLDLRTNNAIRLSILSGGNVGVGATAPVVRFAVGGNGTNVYSTDLWVENNMHVQGNEAVGAGRGRLRVGTCWSYVGLYAEANSLGAVNDLILGSSSGVVRVGPGGTAQKLLLPANTGFQLVDNAAVDKVLRSDASGNATWTGMSSIVRNFTVLASQTSITTATYSVVTGLSQSIVLTAPSVVNIFTHGALESLGASGTMSPCLVGLERDGTIINEQPTDIQNVNGFSQTVSHWSFAHSETLAAGTYVYKIKAKMYTLSGGVVGFNAGGAVTTSQPNDGNMIIQVIPQ